MNKSLQEQLLGARLVDEKKAKKISKENRKEKKVQRRNKDQSLNDIQAAALKVKQDKIERDTELNRQRNLKAEKKAINAQISQMIKHYRIPREIGDMEYHFTDGKIIKTLLVNSKTAEEITRGRLCIARLNEQYEIIPKPIADKIRERDINTIVVYNEKSSTEAIDPTDPDTKYYTQFEIPDDLNW
ncbi:hypothetical protein AB835_03260 [Candidatus Endobugula sertula]|uniref:Nucleoprotein/polynucleotide-associated enzyme n=1 Tax=Candidatus Endobugula sertula TaxID=62101 RepID=A0A1D2QSB0_9GAMM|nr:hypothetical protein AB835_03260 [Candidatus Endobugula sertula]